MKTILMTLIILSLVLSSCFAQNTAQATDSDIAVGMNKIAGNSENSFECPQEYEWNAETNKCEKCGENCSEAS